MRQLARVGILALPLVLVVACGGKKKSGDDSPAPGQQDPGQTEPTPAAPANPQSPGADPYAALYAPKNVPSDFAVVIPGSLLVDTGAGLRLDGSDDESEPSEPPVPSDDSAEAGSSETSQGLDQLSQQAESLSWPPSISW